MDTMPRKRFDTICPRCGGNRCLRTLPFLHGIWNFEANLIDVSEVFGRIKLFVCEDCRILFDIPNGRIYRESVVSEKVVRWVLFIVVTVGLALGAIKVFSHFIGR